MSKIRVGIVGWGNLGRGVELALRSCPDMQLCGVFTRRDPAQLHLPDENIPKYRSDDAFSMQNEFDVMILCGGSASDLPVMGPKFARAFTTVDSFDTHAKIPEYYKAVDDAARASGNVSLISVGWDPGMFSINRLYASAILHAQSYTFWGRGVSQGHSDAVRRIEGVLDAKQYTVPVEAAVEAVRSGENPTLTARQKHTRECFVVAAEGADRAKIEREIKEMPNYFADYDTTVHFISADEMKKNHSEMPHGGFVISAGKTGAAGEHTQRVEYSLKLDSNPEFTSCVLAAYARAAVRMKREGMTGAKTVFDVAPAYLSELSGDELRASLL